ncbi:MAG: tyrosine-type recombinase/integrase [Planctomycetia bacterium]|nr:tyrosine-type recombinase/integrase [Planctomycetia bacterium]
MANRRHLKTFHTRQAADRARKRREAVLNSALSGVAGLGADIPPDDPLASDLGIPGAFRPKAITWEDFLAEYQQKVAPMKSDGTRNRIEAPVLKRFGRFAAGKLLTQITPAVVQSFLSEMKAQGLSPNTLAIALRVLRAIFQTAINGRTGQYLRKNPCEGIPVPKAPSTKRERIPTAEEVQSLLAVAAKAKDYGDYKDLEWLALWATLYFTGRRVSDVLALRWEQIDWEKQTLELTEEKTGKWRVLPLHGELFSLLTRYFAEATNRPEVFPDIHRSGHVLSRLRRLQRTAGLPAFTTHNLRGAFVTHLLAAGVPEAIVGRLTGHANLQTLREHYSNLSGYERAELGKLPVKVPVPSE